jgi:hypothetical protein
MKALSTTLVIVITAIVILVAALVVLTIFDRGVAPLASLAEARNYCRLQATPICETTGQMPFNWKIPSVSYNGQMQSCDQIFSGGCRCIVTGASAGSPVPATGEQRQWMLSGC